MPGGLSLRRGAELLLMPDAAELQLRDALSTHRDGIRLKYFRDALSNRPHCRDDGLPRAATLFLTLRDADPMLRGERLFRD